MVVGLSSDWLTDWLRHFRESVLEVVQVKKLEKLHVDFIVYPRQQCDVRAQ